MERIFQGIKTASSEIYRYLSHNNVNVEKSGEKNESGDQVHQIDLVANEIVKKHLATVPEVFALASEEEENLVYCHDNGKYLIAFDPLDGSQNIDPGLEVGAIFGIFSVDNDENIMKNGRNIVGAAYALFGTTMQFVIAYNNNVTYEIVSSNDILIKSVNLLRMPLFGKYYCTNEANRHNRSNHAITKFFEILVEKKMSCRWGGCMVQDVHRILLQGGIFSYPLDKKNINGKLRLLYECYPMAYIVECAGGNAYLENGSHLLEKPFNLNNLHEKTDVFLMGKEVAELFSKHVHSII